MGLLILGLIMFVMLVVVHEYGHFLVAKRNGVEVEEFGIGFPPKLYGRRLGKGIFEGYYTINLLPLGGFVRLKGEHDADKQKGAYGAASTPAKLRIMLAGVAMNLLVAYILFVIVAIVGMPQLVPNQFNVKSDTKIIKQEVVAGKPVQDSPAAKAGLEAGDIIVSVGGSQIFTVEQLKLATQSHAGQTVKIDYMRGGDAASTTAVLLSSEEVDASLKGSDPKGYLGLPGVDYQLNQSTWSAPIVAGGLIVQFTHLTLKGVGTSIVHLWNAFTNAISGQGSQAKKEASAAGENVSGPVGIYVLLRQGVSLGYQFVLFLIALISLTLAIMNFLPIPALDGGRAFVTLLYRAMRKTLTPKAEDLIHGTGFAALMLLFVVITILDIRRFF